MEAKEKAQELRDKFNDVEDAKGRKIIHFIYDANQCALIAVDEIISNRERIKGIDKLYWQQVKEELNKL